MKKLNMMGKACPTPVVESRKALQDPDVDVLLVEVDNETAVNNLNRLANSIDAEVNTIKESDEHYKITIHKSETSDQKLSNNKIADLDMENCILLAADDFVVVIGSNQMGNGKEELGKILIKGFIYSLSQLENPPTHILFLNSGALLTSEGSNTIEDLRRLEQRGTSILTCGTCVNYYNLMDKLAVGSITDMYGITEITTQASKTLVY